MPSVARTLLKLATGPILEKFYSKPTCTTYIAGPAAISETSERMETLMGFRLFVTSYDRIACTDANVVLRMIIIYPVLLGTYMLTYRDFSILMLGMQQTLCTTYHL